MASSFTIKSDLPDVRRLLRRLQPDQLKGALKNMGEAGTGLAQDAFKDSTAPDGTKWPALQESTLDAWVGSAAGRKRRRDYGQKPLLRTATLMRSLSWQLVGDNTVAIGTAQAHGVFHQGDPDHPSRGIIPPRRFLPQRGQPLPDEWREDLINAVEEFLEGGEA
jgi:phage gpG-like protein